jgi:hypothetical protein
MKFVQLKYKDKTYKSQKDINQILKDLKFYWLIDSELENADIEIEKNTLIWNNGDFFSGNWEYGIFKDGKFYGNWKNGIWENGNFAGKWQSGIKM